MSPKPKKPAPLVRRSILWKLFAGVAGCIALVLATLLLLNTFALKSYYVRQKQARVSRAFRTVNTVCTDEARLESSLLDLQDNGISALIFSGRKALYCTFNADRIRLPGTVAPAPGDYSLSVTAEDAMLGDSHGQAIVLIGTLDNGWHVYLRSPVAAIEESIAITNRFLLITGIGALVVGFLLMLFVAQQYARPIRELSSLADRVARLDFGGRYTGTQTDEIGALGNSINTMSAALEETITQLKNANAGLTADILQKDEQDKARRAFIANVSHELKTPIALIGTYAEGLREDIADGGQNREYYCSVIEDEAHKITALLRRMTMLMQLEGGGNPLEIERFDIAELIANLLEKNRPLFAQKQVTVTPPESGEVFVYADAYLMENVLTNYLSNALHHVPDGGTVAVGIVPVSDGRVRVSVYNSGSSIPEEDLPRIWESFFKVDKARTRAYGGSGIGLSVVAAVMKAHAMPYGVANTPTGVEFFIELETK